MELAYFLMNNVDCLSLFHECSLGEGDDVATAVSNDIWGGSIQIN